MTIKTLSKIQVEILRAIHVFARSKNLICLLAVDRGVVVKNLAERYGSTEHANEYLHKIIQLAVTTPRVRIKNPGNFLKSVLTNEYANIESKFDGKVSIPPKVLLRESSYRWLNKEWDGFIAKSLHYNPRAFEKFKEIFEFRWSVAEEELGAQHKKPNPKMTAAQAIIEIRWPQWNWVAYRFPDAEQEFKKLMKTLAKKSGGLNFNKRAEKLRKRFPQLEPFLKDVSLCEFYKEYYTLLEKK